MTYRIYVMKSKAGHYHATARDKSHGCIVARTQYPHGTKEAAKQELSETLAAKGIK